MVLHRFCAEHQAFRNLRIIVTLGYQFKYLPLALGQFGESQVSRRGLERGEVMDQSLGNRGTEDRLALMDRFDSPNQFLLVGILEQVAARRRAWRQKPFRRLRTW